MNPSRPTRNANADRVGNPTPPARAAAASEADRMSPGSARSLLLTLLGEFVLPHAEPVWTGVLLHTLAGVGVAEKAARQALARAASAGWIASQRDGRRAAWDLTDAGRRLIAEGSSRLRALRAADAPWDGHWLTLLVSLPESHRAERLRLYKALSWIGFGNPMPGLWICPHVARAEQARRVVHALGVAPYTLALDATVQALGLTQDELVARAWNLGQVADHYAALAQRFAALRPRQPDALLCAHVQLVNALQRLPFVDPGLPRALLPLHWDNPRHVARLAALREQWREPAHQRWVQLALQDD